MSYHKQVHKKINKNNVLINLVTDNTKIVNKGTVSFSFDSSKIADAFVPFDSKRKCIDFNSFSANVYLKLDANQNWTICFWSYKTQITDDLYYDIILADDTRYCYNSIQLTNPGSYPYAGMRINYNYSYAMHGNIDNNTNINKPHYFAFVNSLTTKRLTMYEDGIAVSSVDNNSFHFNYINNWGWNDRSSTPGLIDDFMIASQDLWTGNFYLPKHYLLDNCHYSINEDENDNIYAMSSN